MQRQDSTRARGTTFMLKSVTRSAFTYLKKHFGGFVPDETTQEVGFFLQCKVKVFTEGGSIKTLQPLSILLLLCHTADCICIIGIRVSGYLILPCLWLRAIIIIIMI